jgi:hypothetical protein
MQNLLHSGQSTARRKQRQRINAVGTATHVDLCSKATPSCLQVRKHITTFTARFDSFQRSNGVRSNGTATAKMTGASVQRHAQTFAARRTPVSCPLDAPLPSSNGGFQHNDTSRTTYRATAIKVVPHYLQPMWARRQTILDCDVH